MRHVRNRSFRLLTAALAAGSLVLAGCGGDDADGTDARPPSRAPRTRRPTGDPDTWPLTGETVRRGRLVGAEAPGAGAEDGQHAVQRPAGRARQRRPGGRGAGRGRDDPARGVLLLRHPRRGRAGPVDAGQRHRHRLAGRRLDGDQRRRQRDAPADQRRRHRLLQRGLAPASSATSEPQRAVQPVHGHGRGGQERRAHEDPSRRLPAVGRPRTTCRRASTATTLSATLLGGSHDQLGLPRRRLRQREHLRRRRRRVPRRHRARAAGPGRRRGLHRPRGQPGAGDPVRGQRRRR